LTKDGSYTLFHPQTGEHYHSTFGAVQESEHIFIRAGLEAVGEQVPAIHILEVGLGTGLNALLSMRWAALQGQPIHYTALEAFPPANEQLRLLNYPDLLKMDKDLLSQFYSTQAKQQLSPFFQFQWVHQAFEEFIPEPKAFHLVYFDAFSPEVQPEMWTEDGFLKLYKSLKTSGILTTYSCKGSVKRALKAAGFIIEKLPGPPGKREFLRASVPQSEKY
jgi:tRNA U34 5-methylaminomethyl-2-thiouridine-forming methyltransferase MnmC